MSDNVVSLSEQILLDIRRPLQDIRIQSRADMPCDMAMERPYPRIVCVDLPHDVPAGRKQLHVAALGVVGIRYADPVPVSRALVQDEHVVAVEMHWVCGWCWVVDDDPDGGVGAEVLDVPFGLVGEVSLVGEEEDGVVEVCAKGLIVDCPEEGAGAVDLEVYVEVAGGGWLHGWFEGVVRDG